MCYRVCAIGWRDKGIHGSRNDISTTLGIIRYLGDKDPTSRRVMEEILAKEEEHAEDLKTLIESLSQAEIERPDRKRNENAA